jgi:hypothetical protein
VEVQHGLPVLAQDVQAHVTGLVDIRVVQLVEALDSGRVVGEVLVDGNGKAVAAVGVVSLVRLEVCDEVEDVVRVGELDVGEVQLGEVCGCLSGWALELV